ncbi:MAG: ComEC/Rec2 family competence protein [Candidatus Falkowbacteria bacterium]|nr:ComEC/Rec2 family competence protein [Candidatus Falkowbacteria bacterium]
MNKGNFLLFFCGGALSAFILASLFSTSILLPVFIFILFLSVTFFFAPQKVKKYALGFLVFSFAFILAITRYFEYLPTKEKLAIPQPKFFETVFVCENSERNGAFRNLVLCNNNGRYIAKTAAYPEYRYGDCLLAKGTLELPGMIEDFRYDRYLAKQEIYFVLRQASFQGSESCQSIKSFGTLKTFLFSAIYSIRDYLMNRINQFLPEPDAGLAVALLLGYIKTIGLTQQAWFSRAGLSHLIAISGSHITLIAALLSRLAFSLRLKRKSALIFSSSFAIFYVLFSGAAPSAIRAGVMAFLTFLALFFGRENSSWRALLFSATAILFFNPSLLRDDIGFQLSFAAFGGLLLSAPLFQKHLSWWKEVFLVTLICQLFTWPISSYYFSVVSLVAPFANLLSAWIFAPLFIILPIAMIFSYLGNFIGLLFFWPAYLLTKYLLTVARICASLPYATLDYKINLGIIFTYYSFLIGAFALVNYRQALKNK